MHNRLVDSYLALISYLLRHSNQLILHSPPRYPIFKQYSAHFLDSSSSVAIPLEESVVVEVDVVVDDATVEDVTDCIVEVGYSVVWTGSMVVGRARTVVVVLTSCAEVVVVGAGDSIVVSCMVPVEDPSLSWTQPQTSKTIMIIKEKILIRPPASINGIAGIKYAVI